MPAAQRQRPWPPLWLVAVLGFAGCQLGPGESLGNVVPVYAARSQAEAVAAGQFGAVPMVLAGEADIELVLPVPCAQTAVEVRSRDGQPGWVPVDALPRRLLRALRCPA